MPRDAAGRLSRNSQTKGYQAARSRGPSRCAASFSCSRGDRALCGMFGSGSSIARIGISPSCAEGGLPTPTGRGGSSFIDRLIVSITSIFPHCTKRNLRCFNYQKGKAKPPQEFGYCHRQRLERTGSTRPPTENHPGQKNKRHSRPRGSLARA